MVTYQRRTREELGLFEDEWEDLKRFIDDIRPEVNEAREEDDIESPPPHFIGRDSLTGTTRFSPGGWVGRYPGDVVVYPDKITDEEYERMVTDVAGWLELWGVSTAAAVLPIMRAEALNRRRLLLGYSDALITYTEEALAHRPPVSTKRTAETGPKPKGPVDIDRTLQLNAAGRREVAYDRLHFSNAHPLNLLLLRFHSVLVKELSDLETKTLVLKDRLMQNRRYHEQFVQSQFSKDLINRSLQVDFTDPEVLDRAHRESPNQLAELVDIWESYLKDQTLSVNLERQLNIGVKPVEKLYELWILRTLVSLLQELMGREPTADRDSITAFSFGSVTLYYNTSLETYSKLLVPGFGTNPGRPDYALSVGEEIVWIGDAKFQVESDIGLDSYQRTLSYIVDLTRPDGESSATIFFVGDGRKPTLSSTPTCALAQSPFRPRAVDRQRPVIADQLEPHLKMVNH